MIYIYISHILIIHSSIYEQGGCFQFFAIMNKAEIKTGYKYFYDRVRDALAICPGVKYLGHMVVLFSLF